MHHDLILPLELGGVGVTIRVFMDEEAVVGIDLLSGPAKMRAPQSALGRAVASELQAYAADPRFRFSIPFSTQGSHYQCRVWEALCAVESGTTVTYGELAQRLGSGARAVGGACRANPLPVIVPCHRVVARAWLGGYSGDTEGQHWGLKQVLLRHERAIS